MLMVYNNSVSCFAFVKLTICRRFPIDWSPVLAATAFCTHCHTAKPGEAREGAGHEAQVPQVQEVGARRGHIPSKVKVIFWCRKRREEHPPARKDLSVPYQQWQRVSYDLVSVRHARAHRTFLLHGNRE